MGADSFVEGARLSGWLCIISAENQSATRGWALVTGGAVRLGATICRRLHSDGHNVIIHYHQSADAAHDLAEALNARRANSAACVQQNLSVTDAHMLLVDAVAKLTIDLRVLVNNAAVFLPTTLSDGDDAHWQELFSLNARVPYQVAVAARTLLQENAGAIVNITDIHADRPRKGYAIYGAAKAALASLTRSLALELAPSIRVNAIAPGAILWAADESESVQSKVIDAVPLGRIGHPEDIAGAVSYLAQADYVTGQTLCVDGGRTLNM